VELEKLQNLEREEKYDKERRQLIYKDLLDDQVKIKGFYSPVMVNSKFNKFNEVDDHSYITKKNIVSVNPCI
jgi:hypothetical protein